MCSRNFNAGGSPLYGGGGATSSSSNKYRSEDIMSCISALDDVIAEFDDPSLPYIYEDEGLSPQQQQQQPQTVNPSQSQIVPSSSLGEKTRKYFSMEEDNDTKLVLKNVKANHTSQSHVSEKSSKKTTAAPAPPSHLIQIPVFSKSSKNSPATNKSSNSKSVSTSIQVPQPQLINSNKEKVTISSHPITQASTSTSPSSLSSKLPGRPSVVPRTSTNNNDTTTGSTNNSKVVLKSGVGSGSSSVGIVGACGGTYSKGTNQEILLLPRIPSCSAPSDKSSVGSSSSRNSSHSHVLQEPIYSSVGKSRPQLSLGMYASTTSNNISSGSGAAAGGGQRHLHPPQEPEIDYNNDETATTSTQPPVYNGHDQQKQQQQERILFGSGRLSKSSSSGGGAVSAQQSQPTTKEMWNFPSEKNLPRSLRKTRKTCFLEDSNNSEGEKASSLYNESDGEGGGHSSSVGGGGGNSSANEQDPHPSRKQQHNGRNFSKVDDNRKIYEDIVVRSSTSSSSSSKNGGAGLNSQKQNQNQQNPTSDISMGSKNNSFTSFNSYNNNNSSNSSSVSGGMDVAAPMPKPRARQQIPKLDELSQIKYPPPPGKIPKPNPKPGVATNNHCLLPNDQPSSPENSSSSSPFSPMQCENSRTEEDDDESSEKVNAKKVVRNLNNNNGSKSPTTTSGNGNNNTNGSGGGNMMRMMMGSSGNTGNIQSSKNNSTGSASSISRSSSSSSGGDPNYYRKDNLSSSSGVVVTTNSSATTSSSPTHSVNNNSLTSHNNNNNTNNNITIIHAEDVGKVKAGGKSTVIGIGHGQRMHSSGNKSSKMSNQGQQQQRKPTSTASSATTTTVVLNNGVLEVDDGYLSMINRNEAPLLWPEEFIENETFSPDELKRLSVHLPEEDEEEEEGGGDDSSPQESDSCSEEKEIELEIVDYEREPSRRQPQPSQPQPNYHRRSHGHVASAAAAEKKTEYFSDDSLEGDREEELNNFQKKKKNRVGPSSSSSLVSPYLYPNGNNVLSASANSSPNRHYYRQQIMVNTALVSPVRMGQNQGHGGAVSRIPKMVSGKKSGSNSSSPDVKEKVPKRKPCSFFVSLADEGTTTEVNSPLKSTSLPIGSKLLQPVSPVKNGSQIVRDKNNKSPLVVVSPLPLPTSSTNNIISVVQGESSSKSTTAPTTPNLRTASNNNNNNASAHEKLTSISSSLPQPQLRHTKSINTGGPRSTSYASTTNNNNNNANNKRKSTSDLVTVVALTNNESSPSTEQLPQDQASTKTSVFNRTSTFLIPSSSPTSCSRNDDGDNLHLPTAAAATTVVVGNSQKRPRDDETDNDEDDDFSSDFDILGSADLMVEETEPDSLQPLSLTDVNDFVSEIMDTALRQQIKQTQMALNNYHNPIDSIGATTNNNSTSLIENNGVQGDETVLQPQKSEKKRKRSITTTEIDVGKNGDSKTPHLPCDSNDDDKTNIGGGDDDDDDGEERARVALQIEAVVSTFLSDNQSFLVRGESEEDELHHHDDAQENKKEALAVVPVTDHTNECQETTITPPPHDFVAQPCTVEKKQSGESFDGQKEGKVVTSSTSKMAESVNIPETMPVTTTTSISSPKPPTVVTPSFRDSSLVGEEKILDEVSSSSEDDDLEEQPPAFIPTPPPHHLLTPLPPLLSETIPASPMMPPMMMPQKTFQPGFINTNGNLHNLHNSNVRDGKAALDILAERINNSKKLNNSTSPADDQFQVSQFIHDKRNIWAMYDRPFDEDLLTVNNGAGIRGYASRSQENLMDAMTKERFQKSFNSRGQSSTLPLNCRPPASQRRSSTFRNMFNKFRKNKQPSGSVIKEIPEYRDDEVQSITSRETGPSEPGKKRGFFSRLFRRSRKNN